MSQILDHPYTVLITGGSRSGKTNGYLSLINHQPHINKKCLHSKDPFEAKYQLLTNKSKSVASKHTNDSEVFTECSNDMNDVYKNIEEYSPNFDCM